MGTGIIYQHDSATMFRFVLRGELSGNEVQELEHAWNTAKSILRGKELVVDVSGLVDADSAALELLFRMRDSGARLVGSLPPRSDQSITSQSAGWKSRLLRIMA